MTRDIKQAADLKDRLAACGATVYEFPLLEIRQPESTTRLDEAISSLDKYDWIVFASTNAVDFFLERMRELSVSLERLRCCSLAAVGSKTAEQLFRQSIKVDFSPEQFSGESFVKEFCVRFEPRGEKFLWPRTNIGKLNIKELLEARGAHVDDVVAYETHLPVQSQARAGELIQLIESGKLQMITLTSGQAAKNLHYLIDKASDCGQAHASSKHPLRAAAIATIGEETSKSVADLFDCELVQSEASTMAHLVACICNHFKRKL